MAHIPLVAPVINMNGDTRESLLDAHRKALEALAAASAAVAQLYPNGRNFPGQDGAIHDGVKLAAATGQQARWMMSIASVEADIRRIAEAIS